jgi:hypothetical protein
MKISKKTIEKNISNIKKGKPLTIPLKILNQDSRFKKIWDKVSGKEEEDKLKKSEYAKNYRHTDKGKLILSKASKKYYKKKKIQINKKVIAWKNKHKKIVKKYSKKFYWKNREKVMKRERDRYRKKFNIPKSRWRV